MKDSLFKVIDKVFNYFNKFLCVKFDKALFSKNYNQSSFHCFDKQKFTSNSCYMSDAKSRVKHLVPVVCLSIEKRQFIVEEQLDFKRMFILNTNLKTNL